MKTREEKKDTFRRLATQRTNAVLDKLRVLGNCANPQLYDYTEADVRKMFATIRKGLKGVEAKFNHRNKTAEFRL